MKIQKCILTIFVLVITISSCKKNEEVITPMDTFPTPHTVNVPDFVNNYSLLGAMPIPLENPLTKEGIALGRKLFYDKKLSGDNTMSCASCHAQELAFSDNNRFSEGISGDLGNRQAMALINLAWDNLLFWDGRAVSLEDQAFGPIVNEVELNTTWKEVEMRIQSDSDYPALFKKAFGTNTIDSVLISKAIAQFERTLVSFNSRNDRFFYGTEDIFTESEERGFDLFFDKAECIHCHSGPMLTDFTFRNNGLDAVLEDLGLGEVTGLQTDAGKFKVTTLRNIAQTAPYMHDGRFETLEEVIEHYNSGVDSLSPNLDVEMMHFTEGLGLTNQEKVDLIAYLNTFTDFTYLANPDFSNPNQ
jgi:cytochrome c peroxidase